MISYHLTQSEDGGRFVTIYLSGRTITVGDDHPNIDQIVDELLIDADEQRIEELADLALAVGTRFEQLSERVKVAHGRVFFDGDEIDSALTQHIVRCLRYPEDGDWRALVAFLENIQLNPNEHSREQLFTWLDRHEFTVTLDGHIIAYKGVNADLTSRRSGPGIVNGVAMHGNLPNNVGNVVEMPREKVHHDPSQGCSAGLHAADYDFADGYARDGGAVVKIAVNPRDVVSVPTDSDWSKVRCCRYRVLEVIQEPETTPLASYYAEDEGRCEYCVCEDCGYELDEDDECEECGGWG